MTDDNSSQPPELSLPEDPVAGSYFLLLNLAQPVNLAVGRLGQVDFPAGLYAYLGSAHGSGGVRARLRHHLRRALKPHWHVDFLRQSANVVGFGCVFAAQALECLWGQQLAGLPGCAVVRRGFGASDCTSGCPAHLFLLPPGMDLAGLAGVLRLPGISPTDFYLREQIH